MRDFNIEKQINDFFANGGTVKHIAEGERSAPVSLRYCRWAVTETTLSTACVLANQGVMLLL